MTSKLIVAYLIGAALSSGIFGMIFVHPVFVVLFSPSAAATVILSLSWIKNHWSDE